MNSLGLSVFLLTAVVAVNLSEAEYYSCGDNECNSDFDSERCCCLYHYGEYSTEYTEYKCCSSSSFGNVRFCHYNSPTSSPTSSPTLTPWTEPFDPWTEPFHPWTEPHYDYDDYNSDIPWWGWFLICVGSVTTLVVILGLSLYACYRAKVRPVQSHGYVVTPLLTPPGGLQNSGYSVNTFMHPPIGPPPSYFDSEATAPTHV